MAVKFIKQPPDPYFNDVSLLLHMDGNFIDSSLNNFTVTAFGNAQTSSAQKKFGTGSALFDGNGDYIRGNQLFDYSSNFTIEGWVYRTGSSSFGTIFEAGDIQPGQGGVHFYIDGDGTFVLNDGLTPDFQGGTATLNQWVHFAIVRNNNVNTLYINGTAVGSGTQTYPVTNNIFTIGGAPNYGFYFQGYIDDFRITSGIARYTSNFTPSTQPFGGFFNSKYTFSKISVGPNTSLLLHMDGANGSQSFTDYSSNNFTITANGNAQISTSIKKFGNGSAYFDGNGDYLTINPDLAFNLRNTDYTVECWVNITSWYGQGDYSRVISFENAGGSYGILVDSTNVNLTFLYNHYGYNESIFSSTATIGWNHIALVQQGSTTNLYLNGVNQGSIALPTMPNPNDGNVKITIGGSTINYIYQEFYGYIDELRIIKGVARYTSNFTPIEVPFGISNKKYRFIKPQIPMDFIAFWKLNDLTDSSGNGNDLTNNNGVTFDTGKIGNAGVFSSGKWLGRNMEFNTYSSDWSFSVWMYQTNTPDNINTFPLVTDNLAGHWALQCNPDGEVGFGYYVDGGLWGPLPLNTWTHVVGSCSNGVVTLYINGVSQGSGSFTGTNDGNEFRLNTAFGDQVYTGKLDAVGLWHRALTLQEIQALYNNGNGAEP